MRTWEEDLTFPRGPFPPRRTEGGGVAFTAARDDFAFASVVTLPPPPAPKAEPEPEPVLEAPEPEVVPERQRKRGLFRRKKATAAAGVAAGAVVATVAEPVPAPAPAPVIEAASAPVAHALVAAPSPAPPLPTEEPVLSVVDDSAIESELSDLSEGSVPPPVKRRRIGRKKKAADIVPVPDELQETAESQPEPAPEPEPEPLATPELSAPAKAEVPAASASSAPDVFALTSEPQPKQEESPVDTWLTRSRALAGSAAAAPAGWSAPGQQGPGAGDLPPVNGSSWRDPDSEPVPEEAFEDSREESDDTEVEQEDGGKKSRRRRRNETPKKQSARKQKRQKKREGAPDEQPEEEPSTAPEAFIPSFGFAAHPEYDVKWAAAAHWATIPLLWVGLGFVGPFVVLTARGEQSQFVRNHATASLNFQLSLLIYMLLTGFLGMMSSILFLIPMVVGILGATAAWFAMKAAQSSREPRYLFALPIF